MLVNETFYPSFKNHELILDLNLNAFSIYDISAWRDDQTPGLVDYVIYPEYSKEGRIEAVTDNSGVIVTDANGVVVTTNIDTIVINEFEPRHEIVTFLYLSQQVNFDSQTYWGFSRYLNQNFRDWDNILEAGDLFGGSFGFGFESYLLTGYNLSGDMARQGQSIYLQTFCERTEYAFNVLIDNTYDYRGPSACWVSSQWDWNDSAVQGKWGTSFNTYRFTKPIVQVPYIPGNITQEFDYGEKVIITKNKLRGRGRALSLLFEAEYTKDLKLLGWNTLNTKNGEP